MRNLFTILSMIWLCFSFSQAEELNLPFLDINSTGASEFIKKTGADGKDVLIFILDSGVDPAVRGLTSTNDGKVKVIEMQDFTGQVVIDLKEAEIEYLDGGKAISNEKLRLEGFDKLELKPSDGKYFIGVLDEDKYYKNSGLKDINNNAKTDDKFVVIIFKIDNAYEFLKDSPGFVKAKKNDDVWVYYIDEDLDGNIDDESPKFDYKYRFDTFDFFKGEKDIKPLMALSANIDSKSHKLIVNTSDNPHGTHCAGITSGYEINGQSGYNGIAPGAYVVSLKIGNDVLSGGATTTGSMKKAYEYGVKFMKDAGFKYGVYSMSYGIGSVTPGKSDMEVFLNNFTKEHPEIVISVSMGNDGPGINSSGLPASANGVIAVGAMIAPATLKDLYGSARNENWITHFSSRGGCISKPDVVAPGGAASTVPGYTGGDAFWGTSMAAPEVAGACALLMSAALKDNLEVTGDMIKKAIKYTAVKIPGYTYVDYGNGLVNIPKAYEYLKILAKRNESKKLLRYDITTENSYYSDNSGESAYWSAGGYLPGKADKQIVSIKPVFPEKIPETDKSEFYSVLNLKSDVPWLETDKSKIYFKGINDQKIGLIFDDSKLKTPGIYTGRISAYTENEENGGYADFDIQASIVIPYKFDNRNDHKLNLKNRPLKIGDMERIFVEVPPGASSMNILMDPVEGKSFNMSLYVIKPDGSKAYHSGWATGSKGGTRSISYHCAGNELTAGIWELVPYCFYQSREESFYNLNVKFYGISSGNEIVNLHEYQAGEKPAFNTTYFNNYDETPVFSTSGNIFGYKKVNNYAQSNQMVYKKKFKAGEDISKITFDIEMSSEEYNKMTDIAINIYDKDGKSLAASGMDRKNGSIEFSPNSAGEYEFEIAPAFISDEVKAKEWKFSISELYYYKDAVNISPIINNFMIYPQNRLEIKYTLDKVFPYVPAGYTTFGEVILKNKNNGDVVKKVDIELK